MLHFSNEEFESRKQSLLTVMQRNKLDGVLLFQQESMFWLTGYDTFGFCFFQCLVVMSDGRMALLTRSADLRQAELTSIIKDIHIWQDKAGATPASQLKDLVQNMGGAGKTFGVEYESYGLVYSNGKMLQESFDGFATLKPASHLVNELRAVKSKAELTYVKKAAQLADKAYLAAIKQTKPHADEGRILAAQHNEIFKGGGDYPANEFIIGSGEEALLCRYKSGRRKLSAKDQLTLEFAGVYRHYHAAMMATLCVGEATPRHIRYHEAAQQALLACQAALKIGNTAGDVFAAHASVLDKAGLKQHRLNACGYSLGAKFTPSWMDSPMFYANNPFILKENMVMFAHMILMDSETKTAMTLGRTYLITSKGAECLSNSSLELVVKTH